MSGNFEFSVSGKTLKIVFDVPKRTTRNDVVFHASDKMLIAGLKVRRRRRSPPHCSLFFVQRANPQQCADVRCTR
jgi:hypothetical protein